MLFEEFLTTSVSILGIQEINCSFAEEGEASGLLLHSWDHRNSKAQVGKSFDS